MADGSMFFILKQASSILTDPSTHSATHHSQLYKGEKSSEFWDNKDTSELKTI